MPKTLQIPAEGQASGEYEAYDEYLMTPEAKFQHEKVGKPEIQVRVTNPIRASEKLLSNNDSRPRIIDKSVLQEDKRAEITGISPSMAKKVNMNKALKSFNNGSSVNSNKSSPSSLPVNLQHMSPARKYNATMRNQKQMQQRDVSPSWMKNLPQPSSGEKSSFLKINNDLADVCTSAEFKKKNKRNSVHVSRVDETADENEVRSDGTHAITQHGETEKGQNQEDCPSIQSVNQEELLQLTPKLISPSTSKSNAPQETYSLPVTIREEDQEKIRPQDRSWRLERPPQLNITTYGMDNSIRQTSYIETPEIKKTSSSVQQTSDQKQIKFLQTLVPLRQSPYAQPQSINSKTIKAIQLPRTGTVGQSDSARLSNHSSAPGMIITSNEAILDRVNTTGPGRRYPPQLDHHRVTLSTTQQPTESVDGYSQEMINNYKDKKLRGNSKKTNQNQNLLKNPIKTSQLQIKGQNRHARYNTQVTTVVNASREFKPHGVGNVVLRLKKSDRSEALSDIKEVDGPDKKLTNRDHKMARQVMQYQVKSQSQQPSIKQQNHNQTTERNVLKQRPLVQLVSLATNSNRPAINDIKVQQYLKTARISDGSMNRPAFQIQSPSDGQDLQLVGTKHSLIEFPKLYIQPSGSVGIANVGNTPKSKRTRGDAIGASNQMRMSQTTRHSGWDRKQENYLSSKAKMEQLDTVLIQKMRNENANQTHDWVKPEWDATSDEKSNGISLFSDRQSDRGLQIDPQQVPMARNTEQALGYGKKNSTHQAKKGDKHILTQELTNERQENSVGTPFLTHSDKGTLKRISSVASQDVGVKNGKEVNDMKEARARQAALQLNAASGQFTFVDGELTTSNPNDVPLDGAMPRRILMSKPKGREGAGLDQSNATYSHDSSHWHGGDHHLGTPVVARLDGDEEGKQQDDDEQQDREMSPSTRRLLEVSFNDEDPLVAKKRIEKRISNRNVGRFNRENSKESKNQIDETSSPLFKPWDDKPDVTLSVNKSTQAKKRPPVTPKQPGQQTVQQQYRYNQSFKSNQQEPNLINDSAATVDSRSPENQYYQHIKKISQSSTFRRSAYSSKNNQSMYPSPKGVVGIVDRGEEATASRKSSTKNMEFDPDATLTAKQKQQQQLLMTQDIVFDDLETPCWRQRDTEMDTDILEKRAKHPMVIGQSPSSPPADSALRHIKETNGEAITNPRSSFEFGTGLAILGEKPVSQVLDEHQNANMQKQEEAFAAQLYAIHSRPSPDNSTPGSRPARSNNQPTTMSLKKNEHSSNISMAMHSSELGPGPRKGARRNLPADGARKNQTVTKPEGQSKLQKSEDGAIVDDGKSDRDRESSQDLLDARRDAYIKEARVDSYFD